MKTPRTLATCRWQMVCFVALIRLLLLPVGRRMQPLDSTPSLQPHYRPSSLLRVDPPQCRASVRSPRGFCHLCFSLDIATTGSRSSTQKLGSASRPLYAGRRLPSNQVPGKLVPGDGDAPGFDDNWGLNHKPPKFPSADLTINRQAVACAGRSSRPVSGICSCSVASLFLMAECQDGYFCPKPRKGKN
jgi:hypothetical protein